MEVLPDEIIRLLFSYIQNPKQMMFLNKNFLRVLNKYTPDASTPGYGATKYSINNILSLGSNEGEYGFPDTINSELEQDGEQNRNFSFIKI